MEEDEEEQEQADFILPLEGDSQNNPALNFLPEEQYGKDFNKFDQYFATGNLGGLIDFSSSSCSSSLSPSPSPSPSPAPSTLNNMMVTPTQISQSFTSNTSLPEIENFVKSPTSSSSSSEENNDLWLKQFGQTQDHSVFPDNANQQPHSGGKVRIKTDKKVICNPLISDDKREQNRLSAQKYRKRSKDLVHTLSTRYSSLTNENYSIKARNERLEEEVQYLSELVALKNGTAKSKE